MTNGLTYLDLPNVESGTLPALRCVRQAETFEEHVRAVREAMQRETDASGG